MSAWIPLKWEVPEFESDFPWERDGDTVIVTDGNLISVERTKKDAQDHFYPSGRWFELKDVTHWMPLPKLPDTPLTNADRIRQMSDEELATLLAMACPTDFRCDAVEPYEDESAEHHCARCLLPWLKSPAKGEAE